MMWPPEMYLDGETADVVCHMGGHASRKGQRWGLGEDPWEPWFDGTQEDIMFTFPRQCEFKVWQRLCWMKLKKKKSESIIQRKILYFFTLQHTRKLNPRHQVLKCKDKHGESLLMHWKGWQASRVGAVVLVHLQRAAIYYSSRCRASPWLWDLRWARKQGGRQKGRRIESGRRVVSKGKVPGSASPRSQQDA